MTLKVFHNILQYMYFMILNKVMSSCACKGIRTCLLCEINRPSVSKKQISESAQTIEYIFCELCKIAFKPQTTNSLDHPLHGGEPGIDFPGISLIRDFIYEEEEIMISTEIDREPWVESQSGRQKQDYGPKVNFKRKKLNMDIFTGFPPFSKSIIKGLKDVSNLSDFIPIELCNLDYNPERGSAIDPHYDDFWLWGDRLVTLNLLSDTVLSFTNENRPGLEVQVVLPRRSLVIVSGAARTQWKHSIHRHHITSRRLAVTLREPTPEFLPGGSRMNDGQILIEKASRFNGISVGRNKYPREKYL